LNLQISSYVIAVDSIPRNSSLICDLDLIKGIYHHEVISAITPSTIQSTLLNEKLVCGQLLMGRKVTPTEVCVTESHRKCYKNALLQGAEIALVLEDDVVLQDPKYFGAVIESIEPTPRPTIWTFYSPAWSIWRRTGKNKRAIIPPAYADCYLINKEAMEIAVASESVGLADWPSWAKQIDFILVECSGIAISETDSLLEVDRKVAKLATRPLKSLLSLRFKKSVPFPDRFRNIVFYPLMWKVFCALDRSKLLHLTAFSINKP
jgi:GR25 family glycosyltransferase involved in LPS biosynthesis